MKVLAAWTVILDRGTLYSECDEVNPYVGFMQVDATLAGDCEQAQAAVKAAKHEVLDADTVDWGLNPEAFNHRPCYDSYRLLFVSRGHPGRPFYFGWQTGMDV